MYRITTVGSLPLGLSSRLLAQRFVTLLACLLAVFTMALYGGVPLHAQSTSGGGITGTVVDPDGKVVVKAQVTATNTDTGVAITRLTTSEGLYSIDDLPVGTYNVEVVAKGFQRLLQENVNVDNASMFGLNMKLTVGGGNETITVTDAPPYLDTTDSTLGGTIENELYTSLPLTMNGGPRDPTAFQYLMPGVQENPANATNQGSTAGSSGIYGGTGQTNLNQNYVEGVPVSNINAQGSGTQVATAVSVDAVNQFSVQTSGASVSFGGAGSANYTINSGGNQMHGTVYDFNRNTIFDTWGYVKQPVTSTGIETKPAEHQNDYGITLQGPILKDKLFYFVSYEGFRYTKISNTPQLTNVPTMLNRQGNFTDLHGSTSSAIQDPTTTFGSAGRPPWQGLWNGVPTYNVIPPAEFSSISLALQAALPAPTSSATSNNYLASLPLANSNYDADVKIDYTINSRNKLSITALGGNVGYGGAPDYGSYTQLPPPYASGTYTNQKTASGILSYTFIVSQTLINSIKYGYTRNWGEGFPISQGKSMPNPLPAVAAILGSNPAIPDTMPAVAGCNGGESTCAVGITNTPAGNATLTMPNVSFSGGTSPRSWSSTSSTGPTATNAFTVLDNLNWVKNRHNIVFGVTAQWLETNGGSYGGFSNSLSLTYNSLDSGEPYASFLVGAVYSYSGGTQAIQDLGARYRPLSPYIQDNWQVSPKLTLNLGFRYDYLQPYHEVHDRISWVNTTEMNPIVGIPGMVEFAGFPNINNFPGSTNPPETPAQQLAMYAPYMCHCTTPVHPYNQNWEPRVGFAYAINPTLVIRGNFGLSITHAGGVGGGSRATNGTGNSGEFASSYGASQSNSSTPNALYLTTYFAPNGTPNSSLITPTSGQGTQGVNPVVTICPDNVSVVAPGSCNPWTSIPPWTVPGASVNPLNTTGNYDYTRANADHLNDYGCSTNATYCNAGGGLGYADPYYGGRGPQYISFSFGFQKQINKKAVFSADYSGSETHFLPGGSGRGFANNTFSPDYDQSFGTNTSVSGYYGTTPPFPLFAGPGETVEQSLRPFPQYGSFSDYWGNTGNSNYDSIQLQVVQRVWHNLDGLINYTRAKQIDDTGNRRSYFPVTSVDGNFPTPLSANRLDRGIGGNSQTNAFNVAWTYTIPIGRGQAFFATNRLAGMIGGGWAFSGTYQYRDGYPLAITNASGQCEPNTYGGQGPQCFPDYNPSFDKRKARINGRWGRGPGSNASSYGQIQYLDPNAFECPDSPSTYIYRTCNEDENTGPLGTSGPLTQSYKLGNLARNAPDGIHSPGWWDINLGVRRTFSLRETATMHLTFQIEADVQNTTNSTFFTGANAGWDTTGYGELSGQNQQIPPRDWQFAGRFRF
jgi:hypothetical protein